MRYLLISFLFICTSLHARQLSLLEPGFAFEVGGAFNTLNSFDPATNKISSLLTWANSSETMGFSGNAYFVANVHAKMVLRLGFEVLVPRTLKDIQGSYGTLRVLNGKTTTYSMVPTLAWDMFFYTTPKFRAFIGAEIGYAMLRSINEWHYTDVVTGFIDFTERLSAASVSACPYAGIEFTLVDRYSFVFKAGYRILKYRTIVATSGYTNGLDLVYQTNDIVANIDGTNRVYDFSGINLSVAFRVYF